MVTPAEPWFPPLWCAGVMRHRDSTKYTENAGCSCGHAPFSQQTSAASVGSLGENLEFVPSWEGSERDKKRGSKLIKKKVSGCDELQQQPNRRCDPEGQGGGFRNVQKCLAGAGSPNRGKDLSSAPLRRRGLCRCR